MPTTSFSHRRKVEIWGDARPAVFESKQSVKIQLQKKGQGPYTTINTAKKLRRAGYFDIKMKFPSSGNVRLAFTYGQDSRLPAGIAGSTIFSRSFKIKVH
jgi:hypothetical protein